MEGNQRCYEKLKKNITFWSFFIKIQNLSLVLELLRTSVLHLRLAIQSQCETQILKKFSFKKNYGPKIFLPKNEISFSLNFILFYFQEAEQKRLELEKQKELERNAQRAKERAEEQKKREFYEQQLKQKEELAKQAALKKKALQLQSANKQKNRILFPARKDWNYKPRNENDYGLEDENSEVESGDEEPQKPDKPFPAWAKGIVFFKNCFCTSF